jgi:hypothetical protein
MYLGPGGKTWQWFFRQGSVPGGSNPVSYIQKLASTVVMHKRYRCAGNRPGRGFVNMCIGNKVVPQDYTQNLFMPINKRDGIETIIGRSV